MIFFSTRREWITDTKNSSVYLYSTYSLFGIPLIKTKRTNYRTVYVMGIPVFKSIINKKTDTEKITNLIYASLSARTLPPASGILRTLQLAGLELLKKIDAVCKKHDIKYWLDFGTMLGAKRHKGFIPWDDDIDIAMMREDYEKFFSIYKSEFPEDIYSVNYQGFLQLHVKDTLVQVDIFPYDRVAESWFPEGNKEQEFCKKLFYAASQLKYNIQIGIDSLKGISNANYQQIKSLFSTIVMEGAESLETGNICKAIEVPVGNRFSIMNEWIFPLQHTQFEGESFPIPNFPEPILYSNYGDWEKIPSNPSYHFNLKKITKKQYVKLLTIINNGL